jgi:hypothetical protein
MEELRQTQATQSVPYLYTLHWKSDAQQAEKWSPKKRSGSGGVGVEQCTHGTTSTRK